MTVYIILISYFGKWWFALLLPPDPPSILHFPFCWSFQYNDFRNIGYVNIQNLNYCNHANIDCELCYVMMAFFCGTICVLLWVSNNFSFTYVCLHLSWILFAISTECLNSSTLLFRYEVHPGYSLPGGFRLLAPSGWAGCSVGLSTNVILTSLFPLLC